MTQIQERLVGAPPASVPIAERHAAFRDELIAAGVLLPMGAAGMYGKSEAYERVMDGLDRLITIRGSDHALFRVRFPSLLPFHTYEKTDYVAAFPDLTGAVTGFRGNDLDHVSLLGRRAAGEEWRSDLIQTDLMLVSAACHPLYAQLTGTLPAGGRYADVLGHCFRFEPSPDPMRMQTFRMREYVYVGDPATAVAHRDTWTRRGLRLLTDLGLDPRPVPATDPFFGRAGSLLAANQREDNLKTELVVDVYGDVGTPVMSTNYHLDHFGAPFAIFTAEGEIAHSACTGIGVERIVLALFRVHGMDVRAWPRNVRRELFG